MHRIDTPTAQADKFGPGKNGFTNGDPATGRRATDLNSDMWDAVQEEICTVVEKAGLALNKDQHDQLHQAIIKIITSKIPDALLKKNNLSDLADKALARANLQLKAAATKDVTTQYNDTNSGRLMTLGCRGIGGSSGDMLPGADVNTAAKYLQFLKQYGGGIYRPIWNSAVTNPDGLAKYSVNFFGNTGDTFGLISIDYNSGKAIVVGANQAGIDTGRVYVNELYGKLNKPTAADVDAVSATQGGTFQRPVIFNQGLNSRGRITWGDYSNAVGSSKYNAMVNVFDSTGKMRWAFGPYINEWSVYAYNSDGSYKGNIFRLDYSTFNANFGGMVTPANYSNFDARYILSDGAIYAGFVSGDAARPYLRHRVSNAVVALAKAGDSYTKAESDARYQLKNTASRATNGWFKDTTTGMIFQWGVVTLPATNGRQTSANFSFPTTFPNAALTATATPSNTGVSNNGYVAVIAMTALSKSGGTIFADSNSGESFSRQQTIRYIAIGY